MNPTFAVANIFKDPKKLKSFAEHNGFSGIDWSFDAKRIPKTPAEESWWVKDIISFTPLEVRFHCPFYQMDLGHDDPKQAKTADAIFRKIIRLVSKAGGRFLTIHIGLGHNSTETLSWESTMRNLRDLVQFAADYRVTVCLENLAWGWTSKPNLFEKLIRRSGAGVTFDIGHAYACESVRSQHYSIEDFVSPHPEKVLNAHVYHDEVPGIGHRPPEKLADIRSRLDLLKALGCDWWLVVIMDIDLLLTTRDMLRDYLLESPLEHRSAGVLE
jgi:sugar phosphate isomerase/epimerase